MSKKILSHTFLILSVTMLLLSSCDKRDQNINFPPGIQENVSQIAVKQGLTIFAAALKLAKMDTAFSYLGQYTILAPTDAAFNAAGITNATLGSIPEATLRTILRNHILPGRTTSFSFLPGPNAALVNINRDFVYSSTYLSSTPGVGAFTGVYFNGIKIVNVDFLANNGVIHTINGVLLPPPGNLSVTLALNPNLSFLRAAISTAGLTLRLDTNRSPITLLAPDNAAFIAAGFPTIASINAASPTTLSAILTLHVIPAASIPIPLGNGRLFTPDFRAGNYASLNGNVITTVTGSTIAFRGTSSTADATIITPNLLFRSLVPNPSTTPPPPPPTPPGTALGSPSVMHIINRVLLP
ncbi:MAG: fasciclin domain-containing protein [Ferruginibacter sp.]|nr:fasciclin domain-containing protein [Ferruginibacter sp.]